MSAANREVTGIQYVRAVAALLVVLDHAESLIALPKNFDQRAFGGVLAKGAIGVDLFFVVSGFIIAYVSLQRPLPQARLSFGEFMRRRCVRIVPFLWVCVIGYAGLRYLGRGSFEPLAYLRSLVLFPIGPVMPVQVWTLRHELLFYIVFGLAMLSLRGRAGYALILAYAAAPLAWNGWAASCGSSSACTLADFAFNRINLLFIAGVLIGLAYLQFGQLLQLPARYGFPAVVLLAAGLMVFANVSHYRVEHDDSMIFAAGLILCCAIVAFAAFCVPGPAVDRVSAAGHFIGNASFSIYLTHDAFVSAVLGVWARLDAGADVRLVFFAVLGVAMGGGMLVHRFVERPLIRMVSAGFTRPARRGQDILRQQPGPSISG